MPEKDGLWEKETFLEKLREVISSRYYDRHPFHKYMHGGQLKPEQIKGWVANRFYYQKNIPLKDAAIISNCPSDEVRQLWLQHVSEYDGVHEGEGGIDAWLKLASAVGLTHAELLGEEHVLPGVRLAVDTYVNFACTKPWPLAVASSLTEFFIPDLMQERLHAFAQFYTWVEPRGLEYFQSRLIQAKIDAPQGLMLTMHYCDTHKLQEEALSALLFKCDILWTMLDAMLLAYGGTLEYLGQGHTFACSQG